MLCVDEKTQIQALDRTQPILPLRPGLPEGRTHDYRRHGTTSLYAALEIASGQVLTECHPRHRAEEFLAFCRRIVREHPAGELHIVLDNSSTHSTPEVNRWLARHRRVHFHFTPKGASWMNLVESWFSILTRRSVRRGSFASVGELVAAIESFVAAYNERAQPFVWTKPAETVLAGAVKHNTTSETEGPREDPLGGGEPAPVRQGRAALARAAPPGRRGAGAQRPALRPGAGRPVLRRARRAAARSRARGGPREPAGPDRGDAPAPGAADGRRGPGHGAGLRGHHDDPRRRAGGGEAGRAAGPRGGRAALVRPDHARGAEPGRGRPPLPAPVVPHRGGRGQPGARGDHGGRAPGGRRDAGRQPDVRAGRRRPSGPRGARPERRAATCW